MCDVTLDLVMVPACVPIGRRCPKEVSDLINLPTRLIEGGAEDIIRGRITQHGKPFLKMLIGDLSSGGPGNPP